MSERQHLTSVGQDEKLRISFLEATPPDVRKLEAALRKVVSGEVRFDDTTRALYATDASNYRQVPVGVVLPKTAEDVVAAVAVCRRYGVPIVSRGGGTGLCGQTCNVAVVLDHSKYYNRLLDLNVAERYAWVEPGTILDTLREAGRHHHLTFGPDPATHARCTLGGMIGNDSCGMHAQMAGRTADNTLELDVLTYDGTRLRVGPTPPEEFERRIAQGGREGEIYAKLRAFIDRYGERIRARFPKIPRLVSGYALEYLLPEHGCNVAAALVGSESTLVTVLAAKTRLVYDYPGRALLVLGYPDIYQSADHVPELLKFDPIALEGLDDCMLEYMRLEHVHEKDIVMLPEGHGWLIAEFGGANVEEASAKAHQAAEAIKRQPDAPTIKVYDDPAQQRRFWSMREAGLGVAAFVPAHQPAWQGWEDSAVPPDCVGPYLRDLQKLFDKYNYHVSVYGHFGQGCVHCSIDFDLVTAEGIATYRAFVEEAADLVVSYGGSLSGEHGDGQSKAELLPKMFGDDLVEAFREFKSIWDPLGGMNPGKVVDPYPLDSNLRLGTSYAPPDLKTHFKFPDDLGSFAHATLRCVGVGLCRRLGSGTMCPSFMVTREEQHTTRGRAHALFEMMQGQVLKGGWQDEGVKSSLDLCLSCKGCKGDCPVQVDVATYKAEFLSHYYAHKRRPMAAYTMGYIHRWARLAALVPHLANAVTQTPLLSSVIKRLGGLTTKRPMPAFATRTFRDWYFSRPRPPAGERPRVILWADTFNNHFHPHVAAAALEVLEAAGFAVEVPEQHLCCGRPLYDFGMLDQAKQQLEAILEALRPAIRQGVPIVGLEPSCIAVFRDELRNLFPHDEDAKRLCAQSYMLGEFLIDKAPDWHPPQLDGQALVHLHCHHKAVLDADSESAVLDRLGLAHQVLDSGCCGLAGSFGYEPGEHYEVSVKAGERVLLPAVREADPATLVVTDGFSCHSQIAQLTDRRALHLAEVLQRALRGGKPAAPITGGWTRTEQLLAGALALAAVALVARRLRR